MSDQEVVVIRPRNGVTAERIQRWIEDKFQYAGARDDGDNPLVNADITIGLRRVTRTIEKWDSPHGGKGVRVTDHEESR